MATSQSLQVTWAVPPHMAKVMTHDAFMALSNELKREQLKAQRLNHASHGKESSNEVAFVEG